jgi:hypothetical protein
VDIFGRSSTIETEEMGRSRCVVAGQAERVVLGMMVVVDGNRMCAGRGSVWFQICELETDQG